MIPVFCCRSLTVLQLTRASRSGIRIPQSMFADYSILWIPLTAEHRFRQCACMATSRTWSYTCVHISPSRQRGLSSAQVGLQAEEAKFPRPGWSKHSTLPPTAEPVPRCGTLSRIHNLPSHSGGCHLPCPRRSVLDNRLYTYAVALKFHLR